VQRRHRLGTRGLRQESPIDTPAGSTIKRSARRGSRNNPAVAPELQRDHDQWRIAQDGNPPISQNQAG
jgi:hypothetical protein